VWGISSDDPDRLQAFVEAEEIPFPVLKDPDGSTFRRFGILNEDDDRGIPHPTVVVVDASGMIRYRRTETDYEVRPPVDELLEVLRGL